MLPAGSYLPCLSTFCTACACFNACSISRRAASERVGMSSCTRRHSSIALSVDCVSERFRRSVCVSGIFSLLHRSDFLGPGHNARLTHANVCTNVQPVRSATMGLGKAHASGNLFRRNLQTYPNGETAGSRLRRGRVRFSPGDAAGQGIAVPTPCLPQTRDDPPCLRIRRTLSP